MNGICRNLGNEWKPRFYEVERESKMRLLKAHSHTSEHQGHEADKRCEEKEGKVGLTEKETGINRQ